jgi:hypothetical protein
VQTVRAFNPHKWGEAQYVEVPVRWKRREWGGWALVHAETGRHLGWIVRNPDDRRAWDVRLASQAFRGDNNGDIGDVLDVVPARLYNGNPHNSIESFTIVTTARREWAAEHIVERLVNKAAPAVGFPRHPDVDTRRSDRYKSLMEATK